MSNYSTFLEGKALLDPASGFADVEGLPEFLYPFQRDVVRWALRRGRAAVFADCGLGKTPMQLAWANAIGGDVLILAPLAVSQQTAREGVKFRIPVTVCRSQDDVRAGVNVTNYEMLEHFDPSLFAGVVLDESSILKAYDGKTRTRIIEAFRETPFRLACTATPAPNDHMEIGNHAEFLGSMTRTEMLSMFFVHDGGETQKWRLKGHAASDFWRWICSWAVMFRKPSDLGSYSNEGFELPELEFREHVVEADASANGMLFDCGSPSLIERRRFRRESIESRVSKAAEIVAQEPDEKWLIWCDLNAESELLAKTLPHAVEVVGADSRAEKERSLLGFANGDVSTLVTKPKIAGFGMNWQHCARMIFVGLSDSYEALYQATRRCWRFGQERDVVAHIITASTEGAVLDNVRRKETDARRMADEMERNMHDLQSLDQSKRMTSTYAEASETGTGWEVMLGDSVEVVGAMLEESIDYSVFSPPFASLYTYSNSDRDMGNCADTDEFFTHFRFLIAELLRVTKPGRNLSFHCMNLPTSKVRDGIIGLRDFRGELIRAFADAGWIYHSEVVIWKDPVTSMQRTKALGLLHKTIRKDSAMSRQGIPDYVVTMRKPGDNAEPIAHTAEQFPVSLWQKWASPIWEDINPSDTLQKESAREDEDERHICPLQLEVIKRCIGLWSNPGDLVLSPFAGIGSEGYEAVRWDRRFIGVELKRSYWEQAVRNLRAAEHNKTQGLLFA